VTTIAVLPLWMFALPPIDDWSTEAELSPIFAVESATAAAPTRAIATTKSFASTVRVTSVVTLSPEAETSSPSKDEWLPPRS